MSQPYVGEIRMFGGNYAPVGWHFCDGSLLQISQNDVLYALIGTTYGGDGQNTFALPDLRGRVPIHNGGIYPIGQLAGTEQVSLTVAELPVHHHPLLASTNNAAASTGANNVTGQTGATQIYREVPATAPMSPFAISYTGGSTQHDNVQPFLCVTFIISLYGIFPPHS